MVKKFAFLFDNDGVLINSSPYHWQAWKRLMEEEKTNFMDEAAFLKTFGKRNDLILKEVAPQLPEEKRAYLAKRKEELFRQIVADKIQLIEGMENFLKQVKEANIPRIIASSTPPENLEMFLKTTVLGNYFDTFISGEQVAHGKPAPDIFLAAAAKLGFDPRDCVVFEDAPSGIEAGKKAGCFVVALATTHKKEQLSGYDLLFATAKELTLRKILGEWSKTRYKVFRYILGVCLIIVGFFGLFLPFLPGLLFIFLGLYFLNQKWLTKKIHDYKEKFQKWRKKK